MIKEDERQLITFMRNGARMNVSDIARRLKLPISTATDKIRKIESKYVSKRVSLLNFEKVEYFSSSFIIIRTYENNKERLVKFLKGAANINSIYHTNSGSDLIVEAVFEDHSSMFDWLNRMKSDYRVSADIYPILKTEDKEKFIP